MKNSIALALLFSAVCVYPLAAQEPDDLLQNPYFKSSLDWLKDPVPCPDSTAATAADMKAYTDTIPGTEVTFNMVPIPGGKFLLGSPEGEEGRDENEGPQHEVEIQPFWMEEHETTWGEFHQFASKILRDAVHMKAREEGKKLTDREILADAFGHPTPAYDISSISYSKSDKANHPASGMTYFTAQAYCKWLTALTGRYYRLPTEAEWEYACRAGSTTAFSFGDDPEKADEFAWYFENTPADGYEKVKAKKPNKWGLYDMHGNVAEWVHDQYKADTYSKRAAGELKALFVQPKGNFGQVARGGSVDDDDPLMLRSARRIISESKWKSQDPQYPQSIWWVTDAPYVGFRVVRPLTPPTPEEAALYEPIPEAWKTYREQNLKN